MGRINVDERSAIRIQKDCNNDVAYTKNDISIFIDGELYNIEDIKERLYGLSCDKKTVEEILLDAYKSVGILDFIKMLNGIFIICIYSIQENLIYIIRDHMGVRPVFYYKSNNEIWFSNSISKLISNGVPRKLCYEGLFSYMQYESVQEPYTLIDGVKTVPAGSYLEISDGVSKIIKYWDPVNSFCGWNKRTDKNDSFETAKSKTEMLIKDAVRIRTQNIEQVGAFLSGGIDSGSIVSVMRQLYPQNEINTFSIIHDDPKFDERELSRKVSEKNKTRQHELLMDGRYLRDNLYSAIDCFDAPSLDGMNTYFASKMVKEYGINTILSGIGGDEVFIGDDFIPMMKVAKYKWLNKIPNFIGAMIDKASVNINNGKMRLFGEAIASEDTYFIIRMLKSSEQVKRILDSNVISQHLDAWNGWFADAYTDLLNNKEKLHDDVSKIQILDLRTYLLSTELRDTVQMSRCIDVNIRFPLLDYRLVEYLVALPKESKMNSATQKVHLVNAASDGLPNENVHAVKKGFTFPYDSYLKNELKDELCMFYTEADLELFNKKELQKMWNDFCNGKESWTMIWKLFVLDKWIKKWKIEL